MQTCKPGSVLQINQSPYHLSSPNITIRVKQSTHTAKLAEQASPPLASGGTVPI